MSGGSMLTFLVLILLGFIGFVIYFIFKILQFVIVSVNLYKKMVKRQDAMIKLLMDVRDHTKQFKKNTLVDDTDDDDSEDLDSDSQKKYVCNKCGAKVTVGELCQKCKPGSSNLTESDDCICGECGATVKDNDKFCAKCGTEISDEGVYVCSDCDAEISVGDKKCPKCGKTLE